MSAEQTILEKLRTLPPDKQQEVLDFVEFLQQKASPATSQHRFETERIDRSREQQWIEEHREQFAGEWVALDGDRLISHGSNAKEVYEEACRAGVKIPFLARVEPPNQLPFGGW